MQFSPETVARAKRIRSVFVVALSGSIIGRVLLEQAGADAALLDALRTIGFVSSIGWMVTHIPEGLSIRAIALTLAIGLPLAALQVGIVEAVVALPIALVALAVGLFALVRSAGGRPVVALVGALGSVAVLIFAGYAFSSGQQALAVAASIAFGIAVTAAIVRSVNRSE